MGKLIDAVLVKGLPPADIKNANKVNLWALLWASTLIATMLMQDAGTFGLREQVCSITRAISSLLVGVNVVIAYRRMLLDVDEMERAIQYNALALAVAAAFLGYSASAILSNAASVSGLDGSAVIVVMSVAYCCGLVTGRLRLS